VGRSRRVQSFFIDKAELAFNTTFARQLQDAKQ
jgi:hypothetical protein